MFSVHSKVFEGFTELAAFTMTVGNDIIISLSKIYIDYKLFERLKVYRRCSAFPLPLKKKKWGKREGVVVQELGGGKFPYLVLSSYLAPVSSHLQVV